MTRGRRWAQGRDAAVRAWGIGRSLAIYHGIPGRRARLTRFYRQFLDPGDVAFDIGAHVGSRVRAWRRLGVRVIAVEPQPDCLRVLRVLYGRDPHHICEAQYKAIARALRQAVEPDPRVSGVPSTKGVL